MRPSTLWLESRIKTFNPLADTWLRVQATFAKFRLWKQYAVWRKSVVSTKRSTVAEKLVR